MLIILEKKDGKFKEELLAPIELLEDGRYLVAIRSIGYKTIRDCRNEYFALVDSVRDVTGDTRYEIHEAFKIDQNIETTRDFTQQDWIEFIDAFKWYYFQKADILL